jgi:phenylpropionate dioxygenase-like ring-hydroxylating dioxygenase large terminal subunit
MKFRYLVLSPGVLLFHHFPAATSFSPQAAVHPLRSNNRKPSEGLAATVVKDTASSSSSSEVSSPFDNFDYNAIWYPVIWAHELRLKEPTKVTVFDVDYVVAKIGESEVVALEDRCPHKAAALSQGRVTANGRFQCAYHGWSFDGKSGDCLEIPQVVKSDGTMPPVPSRSCAKAVPVQIHQNMVWLFPGGGLEEALLAPPPPTVKEVDELNFTMSTSMREMPVDWPIIVSNICDADHGLFAHQAKPFDMYSASKDNPLQVSESFPNDGKGWILNTRVEAAEKLLEVDRNFRGVDDKKKKKNGDQVPLIATSSLQLPTHLQLKRVDRATNITNFVSGFYICPTGVGRTRFMSAGFSKKPPKNWLTKIFLDNFLDQDTYLLATQQQYILQQEAKDIRKMMSEQNLSVEDLTSKKMTSRRELFCLSSPTEKAGAKIEQFWDATLLRVPNRVQKLLQLDGAGTFLQTPSRESVLDRKSQHLDITPSAQDVVRNCDKVVSRSTAFTLALVAAKLLGKIWVKAQVLDSVLKPWALLTVGSIATAASLLAKKVKAEYFYKYTDEFRRNDLSKIPKMIWSDK